MAHASPAVVMLGFFLLFMTTMEVVFVVVQGAGVFQLVAQIQCTTTFDQQQRNRQQVSVRVGALNADVIFTVSRVRLFSYFFYHKLFCFWTKLFICVL
jgi:hypothetical protein